MTLPLLNESPSPAYQLLAAVVAEVEADQDVESLLDLRADEPVIDLRDPAPADQRRTRRAGRDVTLALVLNRVRYQTLGLQAVGQIGERDRALTELAALRNRATPPDVSDLVRQAAAFRSVGGTTSGSRG